MVEKKEPKLRYDQSQDPVDEEKDGDAAKDDEPEPEDEVDLLVDDVLGEDTDPVVDLEASSSSNVRVVAGDLFGKSSTHRVVLLPPLVLRQLEKPDGVVAVPGEPPAQELVRQVEL